MTEHAVLSCQGLTKTYRDGALKVDVLLGVDINIAPGERVVILGPSGAGKSTLLHLLGGLDRANAGKVFIAGEDISTLSEVKLSRLRNRKLGFVYQFHHLLPEFTALENVAMPLLIGGSSGEQAKAKAGQVLASVGLAERVDHKIGQLSGGERQRIAIARAIVTNPLCVLADEPTGNLDHKTAEKVYDTMFKLNGESQTSFLFVTHDVRLAERMDRVLYLEDGLLHHRMQN